MGLCSAVKIGCRINRNKLLLQPEIRAVEAFHFTFCIVDFLLKLTALLVLAPLADYPDKSGNCYDSGFDDRSERLCVYSFIGSPPHNGIIYLCGERLFGRTWD